MNFNLTLECTSCDEVIDCRVGMSNRKKQPLRFACPGCSAPIDIDMAYGGGMHFRGAHRVHGKQPFDNSNPFVDLHLDFPVYMGEYQMGNTPFIRAASQIQPEEYQLHNVRLNMLNEGVDNASFFGNCLKFYRNEKVKPFINCAEKRFGITTKSELPQDLNATLYSVIAKAMAPFTTPHHESETVNQYMEIIFALAKDQRPAIDAFIAEVHDTGFAKALQFDCLEVYPRVLAAELPLRPVLFLDFDCDFADMLLPVRVSTHDFEMYKDLYKDITEIISRQLVLIAGVNNLMKRADHNTFLPGIGMTANGRDFTPTSLNAFADVPFGKKMDFIDDSWFDMEDAATDNQLRNSIAHYKTEYDDITQVVTYYPRREGMEEERSESMQFIAFMRRILLAYREMHRMHHLIKAILYYPLLMK
ncbi:hypothetical protein Q8W37_20950 [Shimia thalassica]|uniref:hypothetical protein n=1 Tax=Shimia thalassica TaxID=1715693 RepID=UPI0027364E5B|nr:hypothetical protein [Shimia thalassica]MDP2582415.1 hypothetical protein [Shimia thalassica]